MNIPIINLRSHCRYECTTCEAFNLCERCWDRFQSGALSHDSSHNWQHHGPR